MAPFTKFSLKNFRGFDDAAQTLVFGIPLEEVDGAGITYLVGANNSGKTTLLEGLSMKKNNNVRSSEKHGNGIPEFTLFTEGDTVVRHATLIRPESSTITENPELPQDCSFEIISSRRHWTSDASGDNTTSQLLINTGTAYTRKNEQANTALILKNIEKSDDKYKAFILLMQEVVPGFSKFTIGFEDTEYIEYISGSGVKHKSDFLGDGIISIIKILSHLFENTGKPLVIDEPELSLHPLAQKKLSKLLGKFARTRQIIISTHSPYFIEWEFIKNGAKLNRVVKEGDKECKIYTLQAYSIYSALLNGANWQQPYLLDAVAKEIFFQENILFLEGQEDVGLLRDHFANSDINIFGYGVRGYNGFKIALQLAKDIGIQKASVLLDAPTAYSLQNPPNENTLKAELEVEFPEYKILQWNKNDIRDKPVIEVEEKTGYFTKRGKLKAAAELDDFEEKIALVKNYFG